MDYATAVKLAPPGWRHFQLADIDRLPRAVREHAMASIPPGEPADRVLRALFWTLVYHLEAERWDELARVEPLEAELIHTLPEGVELAIDVGAGSGRLTRHLCGRARRVVAVEPSLPLCAMLTRRLASVQVIAGWAEALPLPSQVAQLTAACGALGPDPVIIGELQRVTSHGGVIALINPEQPERFVDIGWSRTTIPPPRRTPHQKWIDEFFGPPDPPRELLMRRVP